MGRGQPVRAASLVHWHMHCAFASEKVTSTDCSHIRLRMIVLGAAAVKKVLQ